MLQKQVQNNVQATQYDTLWHFVCFHHYLDLFLFPIRDMAKPSTLYYWFWSLLHVLRPCFITAPSFLPLNTFSSNLEPWEVRTIFAKSLQLCPTLCNPIDGSPSGSSVPGILQARTLEWVAISFSNAWKWKVKVKLLSCAQLLMTPWTAAYQAPPSMGFSRQKYWSGVPLPSPRTILTKLQIFHIWIFSCHFI